MQPSECWTWLEGPYQCFLAMRTEPDETVLDQIGRVALRIDFPEFNQAGAREVKNALCVAVDPGLGEVLAGQHIAFIEACALPPDPERDRLIRLNEFGDYIKRLSRRKVT